MNQSNFIPAHKRVNITDEIYLKKLIDYLVDIKYKNIEKFFPKKIMN